MDYEKLRSIYYSSRDIVNKYSTKIAIGTAITLDTILGSPSTAYAAVPDDLFKSPTKYYLTGIVASVLMSLGCHLNRKRILGNLFLAAAGGLAALTFMEVWPKNR